MGIPIPGVIAKAIDVLKEKDGATDGGNNEFR